MIATRRDLSANNVNRMVDFASVSKTLLGDSVTSVHLDITDSLLMDVRPVIVTVSDRLTMNVT